MKRTNFDEFMDEVDAEAKRAGRAAVVELRAFNAHFATVAAELAGLRKEAKLTQQELAARSGVNQAEISRIEKNAANPTMKTLTTLGRVFNVRLGFVRLKTAAKKKLSRTSRPRRAARRKK